MQSTKKGKSHFRQIPFKSNEIIIPSSNILFSILGLNENQDGRSICHIPALKSKLSYVDSPGYCKHVGKIISTI